MQYARQETIATRLTISDRLIIIIQRQSGIVCVCIRSIVFERGRNMEISEIARREEEKVHPLNCGMWTRHNNEKKIMKRSGDKRERWGSAKDEKSGGDNKRAAGICELTPYPFILCGAAHVAMHAARGARCITKRISIIINRPILRNDKNAVSRLFSFAAASPALASLAQASGAFPRWCYIAGVYLMSLVPPWEAALTNTRSWQNVGVSSQRERHVKMTKKDIY